MEVCEQHGLHQVNLLSPAKSKITDKEYRAQQRGQKKLDELNKQIVAAKMKPRTTVFQTQKQYLRDAISDLAVRLHLKRVVSELPQALHFNLYDLLIRFDLVYINRHKHTFLSAHLVHLLSCRSENR